VPLGEKRENDDYEKEKDDSRWIDFVRGGAELTADRARAKREYGGAGGALPVAGDSRRDGD
jgi:hypothetical protein